MGKPLCRQNGLYQWDADVAAHRPGASRKVMKITVFSDTREDAIRDASKEVERCGYVHPTVNHVTKIR